MDIWPEPLLYLLDEPLAAESEYGCHCGSMAAGRAKASSRDGLGAVAGSGLAVNSVAVVGGVVGARGGKEREGLKLSKTMDSGRWLAGHKCGPDDGGADRGLPAWVVRTRTSDCTSGQWLPSARYLGS